MDPVIFLEKVRQPDARGLVRTRLLERLTAVDRRSVALLLAPPGSGKTTALSHLRSGGDVPVAWYRADPADAQEAALVAHLGYALGAALGRPELIASSADGQVGALVRALEPLGPVPTRLVVDDLQDVVGTPAEEALERFLRLRPRWVQVLLAARRPTPGVNTSRLLVSGDLDQLDGDDLRFRSWEVEELFALVYERPLSPEAAAALTRRTGGWAAGLHLFHLSTADLGRVERDRAVHQLSGRASSLRSYLTRNVLAGLAPERLAFLMRTCTLGVLTAELCDRLLGCSGSGTVLAELEAQQLFTTSTDGGTTFRYHRVLQAHLELLLADELGTTASRALWLSSAQLLEQADHRAAAVRAYGRAEEWGAVARLLDPATTQRVVPDEDLWGALSSTRAPSDDPGLALAGARRLLRQGRVGEAVDAFRRAETLHDDPAFVRSCSAERAAAALWLPDPPGARGNESTDLLAGLRRLTRGTHPPTGSAYGLLGALSTLVKGDPTRAEVMLSGVGASGDQPAWEPLAARVVLLVVQQLREPSRARPELFESMVLEADVGGWPWLARMGRVLQAASAAIGDPATWRWTACAGLLQDLEDQGDRWSLCLACLVMGFAWAACPDAAAAARAARRAAQVADELDAPLLASWAAALGRDEGDRPPTTSGPAAPSPGEADLRLPAGEVLPGGSPGSRHETARPLRQRAPGAGELCCLGGFVLRRGGVPLSTDGLRPRVRLLLMRLAVQHGRLLHREQLVDQLWPEATTTSGVRSLQVAVSALRGWLDGAGQGEDCITRRGDGYALELRGFRDQVVEFERLAKETVLPAPRGGSSPSARRGALHAGLEALKTYAGDLLPELGATEWVLDDRERLRLLAATSAARTARLALGLEETTPALWAARRSVELDPYCDSSWRLLIELYLQVGDRSAAEVARLAQDRVHTDLGLEGAARLLGVATRRLGSAPALRPAPTRPVGSDGSRVLSGPTSTRRRPTGLPSPSSAGRGRP